MKTVLLEDFPPEFMRDKWHELYVELRVVPVGKVLYVRVKDHSEMISARQSVMMATHKKGSLIEGMLFSTRAKDAVDHYDLYFKRMA